MTSTAASRTLEIDQPKPLQTPNLIKNAMWLAAGCEADHAFVAYHR